MGAKKRMKSWKRVLAPKNIGVGYLYFYVHCVTEVVCFAILARVWGDFAFLWMIFLMYDALAFVPQAVIGFLSDKFPKFLSG